MTLTFENKLSLSGWRGEGFGFCRVLLALLVMLYHSITNISINNDADAYLLGPIWVASWAILPMFFGLSGFLVYGSATRLDVKNFYINRATRIFPALAVEVLLSALIIGPLITTYDLSHYFSSGGFWNYFLNIIGDVHLNLPGVEFPTPRNKYIVNGSLWTIPVEMACYFLVIFVFILKFNLVSLLIPIALALSYAFFVRELGYQVLPEQLKNSTHLIFLTNPRGTILIMSFLFGAILYKYKNIVPYSPLLCVVCLALIAMVGFAGDYTVLNKPYWGLLFTLANVYFVIYCGLSPLDKFAPNADYSYGIYLYSYPIQKTITIYFPALVGHPFFHFFACLPIVMLFASMSWFFIELPLLRLRHKSKTISSTK